MKEQRPELTTYFIDRFGLRLADGGSSQAEDLVIPDFSSGDFSEHRLSRLSFGAAK